MKYVLGKGSFGVVMRAIWTIDQSKKITQDVAMKIITQDVAMKTNKHDSVIREVIIIDAIFR